MESIEETMTTPQYQKTRDIIKKTLFPTLRKNGFIARMNFSCCSTCASYELTQVAKEKKIDSVVFYHQQDEDHFKTNGSVHLRYFSMLDDSLHPEAQREVGQKISEIAKGSGLKVDWNGLSSQCIQVTAE